MVRRIDGLAENSEAELMRRRELEAHRSKLSEIRDIMGSMKTLAMLETHKLKTQTRLQSEIAGTIEEVAADFLYFHPGLLPALEPAPCLVLGVGSERGFCGDFNARIAREIRQNDSLDSRGDTRVILLGSKLHSLFSDEGESCVMLRGADVADELTGVLDAVAEALAANRLTGSFYVVHYADDDGNVSVTRLLPPFLEGIHARGDLSNPPLLNLNPHAFMVELTEQYLFTRLLQILYLSLSVENHFRALHLDRAVHHLDEKDEQLGRRINMLRQEEIIEEIEVILLNAAVDSP